MEKFGRAVGIAFQLIDDALDYVGATELFGKKPCGDISEGKLTLPLLLARSLASPDEKAKLSAILSNKANSGLAPDDVNWIAQLVNRYKTDEITIERAATFTAEAISALSVFPDNQSRRDMEALANNLVLRLS